MQVEIYLYEGVYLVHRRSLGSGDSRARDAQASARFCCLAGLVGVELEECGCLAARSGRGRWRFVAGGIEEGALSLLMTLTAFSFETAGAEDGPG